jgi:hypothetical protein
MPSHVHYKLGCDAHKYYSLFAVLDRRGRAVSRTRVNHEPGAVRAFVSQFPPGTPVALETVGNWYCLHRAAGTGGSWMRSRLVAACRSWPTPPKPRS